jgi:hypothetical protein
MSDWIEVKGYIEKGYEVASGQTKNPRFPQGTIEMQKPFFRDRGLDLSAYFPGTINLSIAPCKQGKRISESIVGYRLPRRKIGENI